MHHKNRLRERLTKCEGLVLGNLFFEPSTRTASSFESAMRRLGGQVTKLDPSTSSATKGETLEDTIRVMETYCDIIAMRHPEAGAAHQASLVSSKPLLNAGDGAGEH